MLNKFPIDFLRNIDIDIQYIFTHIEKIFNRIFVNRFQYFLDDFISFSSLDKLSNTISKYNFTENPRLCLDISIKYQIST